MAKTKDNEWINFSLSFQSYLVFCIRTKYKLTQAQIAEYFNVDQATISRIEGRRQGKDILSSTLSAIDRFFPRLEIMSFLELSYAKAFHLKFINENKLSSKELQVIQTRFDDLICAVDEIHKKKIEENLKDAA